MPDEFTQYERVLMRRFGGLCETQTAPTITVAEVIQGLYRGLLGRDPDPPGFRTAEGHLASRDAGDGIAALALQIIRSEEFAEKWPSSRPSLPHAEPI